MSKKQSKNLLESVETLIGENAVIEGSITTDKVIRIDGKITGNINAYGVIVGQKAEITGDIETKNIIISGLIKGNINASETIEVLSQANIVGDIKANILSIAQGACFYGKSEMTVKENNSGEEKE
ncbi:MAG: polymer-forming cytoskeletal protein [Endomicrobium sp.]|jgi:cytoskeletal protein CcmA (bactofilin family)|uniref:bactofilin family protein n=1 Tax=Candidatus Endomicrobiellum cubanum TaxID=3242325 RepID=UPI00283158F0|nr:polymer-forming cytoskeletal protein [Endomicrobium sp.]